MARLGTTLMHEHVFVLNEEIRLNYPGDWDEEARIADAAAKLNELQQRGCDTIADPTVIGLGRDIRRIRRVADRTDINIIAATGLYTYDDVPFYFRYRGAQSKSPASDPMTAMFIADITDGIAGSGVRARGDAGAGRGGGRPGQGGHGPQRRHHRPRLPGQPG